MIEVEKKVALQESDLQAIERLGTFIETYVFSDTYFDTKNFDYTKNDIWLRERNSFFELKIGMKNARGKVDTYREIQDATEILKELGYEKEKTIRDALEKGAIFPFATYQTIRRKYQVDQCTVDLDLAYFDDFVYRIAEIEVTVNSPMRVPHAEKAIEELIEKIGIDSSKKVIPKLIAYLAKKSPVHHRALVDCGIIPQDASQEREGHLVSNVRS